MRIIFWHNCLSPHQLPYIIRLMDDKRVDEVVFVAPVAFDEERKKMGWSVDVKSVEKYKVQLIVNPSHVETINLLEKQQANSWHVFCGIRADAFVFKVLKMSLKYQLHRAMVTELPNTYDFVHNIQNAKPLCLHRIRFFLQDRKYAKKIEKVFAMGNEAVKYFKSVNKGWQVVPFCYCTEEKNIEYPNVNGFAKFVFAGSLSSWKNPAFPLKCINEIKKQLGKCSLITYIGDGTLRANLEKYVINHGLENQCSFLGMQPQPKVPFIMNNADVLILPSLYDGWGAVVNEALQVGCFVICSDACGASNLLLANNNLGLVFKHNSEKDLYRCMSYCVDHIDEIREDRTHRKKWAHTYINGSYVAKYFVDILDNKEVKFIY